MRPGTRSRARRARVAAPWPIVLLTVLGAVLRFVAFSGASGDEFFTGAVRGMSASVGGFVSGAYEPGRILAADKPLVDLWAQAASVRIFGWSGFALVLPEGLAGALAVPLLYDAVRRMWSRPAGLAAAAVLALAPDPVLGARSAEGVRTLVVVLALWYAARACRTTGRRAGVLVAVAGGVLGLAFEGQLAESLLCLPALLVLYGLGADRPGRRRALDLAQAVLALVVAGLLWDAVVSLMSRAHPWAVGSSPGAIWGAAGRFNGLGPPTGVSTAPGVLGLLGNSGWHLDRLFGAVLLAGLALGLAALAVGMAGRREASRLRVSPFAAATVVWLIGGLSIYGATGTAHVPYLAVLAPALAIMFGASAAQLAGFGPGGRPGRPATLPLTLALAGVCLYTFHFHVVSASWGALALLMAAVGAALLGAAPGRPRVASRWLVAGLVVASALVAPVHETLAMARLGAASVLGPAASAPANAWALSGHLQAPTHGIEPTLGQATPVRVSSDRVGPAMPTGFLGLSMEYSALEPYVGRDAAAINPVFLNLVRGLDPGGAPVLRIGGDSTDHTWWPTPGVVAPGGISYSLTPTWLHVARAVAADLGARMILGVNLAADRPALAAGEARALLRGVGRRYVEALEIGNEADIYNRFPWYRAASGRVYFARSRSYDLRDFIRDFSRWRAAMPAAPLAGPAFAELSWMSGLATFLHAESGLRLVTFHRYPTRGCQHNLNASTYASIANLLSDGASAGLAAQVAPWVRAAHAAGLPARVDEINSASCGGRAGVSNTFASSLWAVDTMFNLAAVGVNGVNVHTLPRAAYAPFRFRRQGNRWSASVNPIYYGLLMFARAFPAGAHLLSLSQPAGRLKAWATQAADGAIHVVLINESSSARTTVRLRLPGRTKRLTGQALRASSLTATSGITLGGQSFGASTSSGVLPTDPDPAEVSSRRGSYIVSVAPGSAVMLTRSP